MCLCKGKGSCHCLKTNEAVVISFPALIKGSIYKGKRIIEFEASNETSDQEGDVILQSALLDAAPAFIEKGHIDIDHYSELGKNPAFHYLGITNPDDWIIGTPLEVKDLGKGCTGVKAEIFQQANGKYDPEHYKYDAFWKSLQSKPVVKYYASVYGFPGADTEEKACAIGASGKEVCATRYLVKSFDWRSTAVTRNPINDSIKSTVRIITAKAFAAKMKPVSKIETCFSREAIYKSINAHLSKSCPSTDNGSRLSVYTLRDHYINCKNQTYNMADMYALATMELLRRQ
jgi:hypothetical protein